VSVASLSTRAASLDKRPSRLLSIPFLLLRSSTAAGAFAIGLVQTFVFARVLAPQQFSIYIVLGAIGYSLWVCDLGLAKILFVQLRAAHLAGRTDQRTAGQASAVIVFYGALAVAGSLACFAVMMMRPAYSVLDAADLALFFLFIALNLPWYCLRNISISVDQYIFYEKLELLRRVVNAFTMLAMLWGLPFTVFLVSSNVLWVALLAAASVKLLRCGALAPCLRGLPRALVEFLRSNRRSIARSGTFALSELFSQLFPYYVVPIIFGFGAPVIIFEATMRIFRGAGVINAAACDLAVPGQTRAFAARDTSRLVLATLMAAGFCSLPVLFACALLIFAAQPLFAFMLHSAATVPLSVMPILVVLLLASLVQNVSQSLLQYTGFFREISRISLGVAAAMILMTILAVFAKWSIVTFIGAYATVYTAGTLASLIALIRGPIRVAAHPHSATA
jgi:O-antigen/teichoic acid export membrane protein